MVNREMLLLFSMVYCMIGGGCSDSPCSDKVNWDDEMKLIERCVYSGKYPQDAEWRRICDKIGTVDVKDVVALGEMFSQILESVKFNDKEYRLREFSLSVYLEFVNKLSAGLAERNHDYEKKMDFLLRAYEVFDREYVTVSAFDDDWGKVDFGIHLRREDYFARLYTKRFYAFRCHFEGDRPFSSYYHSLPAEKRSEILEKLEAAAKRKIVIYDPKNPHRQLPRMDVKYLNLSEMQRKIHLDALKRMESEPGVALDEDL